MHKKPGFSSSTLLPADIDDILDNYGDILQSYQNLYERNSIYGSFKLTKTRLEVLFPLKEHPVHGITGIHATEQYDKDGYVREYHYQWKRIIPKKSASARSATYKLEDF